MGETDLTMNVVDESLDGFYAELKGRLIKMARLNQDIMIAQIQEGVFGLDATASEAEKEKARKIEANIRKQVFQPILVLGDPGIGKTEGVRSCIAEINEALREAGDTTTIGYKTIALGQTLIGDMSGIPVPVKVTDENGHEKTIIKKVQSDDLPREGRDPDIGVLLLDEITTANPQQAQPAFSLLDSNRGIGPYKLPKDWLVIGAGNGPKWSNFVALPSAISTRCMTYNVEANYQAWKIGYAATHKIDPMVLSFLDNDVSSSGNPAQGDTFMAPPEQDGTGNGKKDIESIYPSPRGWAAVSSAISADLLDYARSKALKNSSPANNMSNVKDNDMVDLDKQQAISIAKRKQLNNILLQQLTSGNLDKFVAELKTKSKPGVVNTAVDVEAVRDEYYDNLSIDRNKILHLAAPVGAAAAEQFAAFLAMFKTVKQLVTVDDVLNHTYKESPSVLVRKLQDSNTTGVGGGAFQLMNLTTTRIVSELDNTFSDWKAKDKDISNLSIGLNTGTIKVPPQIRTHWENYTYFLAEMKNEEILYDVITFAVTSDRIFCAVLGAIEFSSGAWKNFLTTEPNFGRITQLLNDARATDNQ